MHYKYAQLTTILLGLVAFSATASGQEWTLKGDWSESCCCQPACPCVFGSSPSRGHCEGSALFEIEEGRLGDVRVNGLNAVLTYRMGEWIRVYVDEEATDEQMEAVATLLNQDETFGMLFAELRSVERAPVTVEKSEGGIEFATPDARVELTAMTGPDGDVIRIENLSVPWFLDGYEQYKAVTINHTRSDEEFAYTDTNGALSRVEASGVLDAD